MDDRDVKTSFDDCVKALVNERYLGKPDDYETKKARAKLIFDSIPEEQMDKVFGTTTKEKISLEEAKRSIDSGIDAGVTLYRLFKRWFR